MWIWKHAERWAWKYVRILMPANSMEFRCDVWSERWFNRWPKKPDLPWCDIPLQHKWTGLLWYDMTHALIILSEVTVGIVQDAPYSVSTVDLLRMVGIFKSNNSINSVCPPWQQRIKWYGEEESSSFAENARMMLNDGLWKHWRRPHASTLAYGLSIIWLAQRQARRRIVKERDRDRNKDTERVKALPHEAPSSDSRQRETEEERKVNDSTSIHSHLTWQHSNKHKNEQEV